MLETHGQCFVRVNLSWLTHVFELYLILFGLRFVISSLEFIIFPVIFVLVSWVVTTAINWDGSYSKNII
jgi:hypothetical protein